MLDTEGKTVESYVCDSAGNLLDKTVSSERYLNEPHATGGNPVLA